MTHERTWHMLMYIIIIIVIISALIAKIRTLHTCAIFGSRHLSTQSKVNYTQPYFYWLSRHSWLLWWFIQVQKFCIRSFSWQRNWSSRVNSIRIQQSHTRQLTASVTYIVTVNKINYIISCHLLFVSWLLSVVWSCRCRVRRQQRFEDCRESWTNLLCPMQWHTAVNCGHM